MVKRSGRPNFLVMSLKVRNQEDFYVEWLEAEKRTCLPCRLRLFLGPSLAIISRALSIRRCRIPKACRLPARNMTTASGVAGYWIQALEAFKHT